MPKDNMPALAEGRLLPTREAFRAGEDAPALGDHLIVDAVDVWEAPCPRRRIPFPLIMAYAEVRTPNGRRTVIAVPTYTDDTWWDVVARIVDAADADVTIEAFYLCPA